jgi:hypothetical protein
MHVGEKYKLYIPAELAYGAQSPSPLIPANSVLVFDLELLGIKDPASRTPNQPRLSKRNLCCTTTPVSTGRCRLPVVDANRWRPALSKQCRG